MWTSTIPCPMEIIAQKTGSFAWKLVSIDSSKYTKHKREALILTANSTFNAHCHKHIAKAKISATEVEAGDSSIQMKYYWLRLASFYTHYLS